MTIILSEEETESLMQMEDCVRVIEETFSDFGAGEAVSRPRTHTYTYLEPDTFYNFKSMDGSVPRYGVHALRISSEVVQTQNLFGGVREEKLGRAQGGRYVGLMILFDMKTTEPIAIMQEAGIQRMRVGATSAVAAKYFSRQDAKRVGLFGTGWQAAPQIEALSLVREIDELVVYSLNPENKMRFTEEMAARFPFKVLAAKEPRQVVENSDIIVCATNSQQPVFDGRWLQSGQHVNSLQAGELDSATHERADVIGIRAYEESRSFVQRSAPERPIHAEKIGKFNTGFEDKLVALGDVVAGKKQGREDSKQVTLFGGSGTGPSSGLGIQFAAVGKLVYDLARAKGVGREIPTEWLTQVHHP